MWPRGIILLAQLATRKIKPVPTGLQNFWEWMVESLYNFLEGMIGRRFGEKDLLVLCHDLHFHSVLELVRAHPRRRHDRLGTSALAGGGFHGHDRPFLRGANADLNLTFAMACIFFVLWMVWAVQSNGVGGVIMHLFAPKGDTKGILKILMIFIFFIVGWLEIVSILFRPISLSFRLFGNVYAGEIMLESMAHGGRAVFCLAHLRSRSTSSRCWSGVVQALVFMLLTAVFTLLIASHEGGHETTHH